MRANPLRLEMFPGVQLLEEVRVRRGAIRPLTMRLRTWLPMTPFSNLRAPSRVAREGQQEREQEGGVPRSAGRSASTPFSSSLSSEGDGGIACLRTPLSCHPL